MAPDDDLRQQLAELSARVASLEAAMQGTHSPGGFVGAKRPPPPPPKAVSGQGSSLESRIGAQLLNRIGILAVLIGMAWFLKLAFDRNWIGPGIRVWIGLACAAGIVAWSERFRRQGFPTFSYSLKALGTGVAYLSLWAASSVFDLAPTWLIFLAMTAVTIANAALAWSQDSELLAIYALAGGLATPGLLSTGHGNQVFLFSYLALLNVGALLLLTRHPWKRLAWAALVGTAVYYAGWTLSGDSPPRLAVTACFLGLFFAGFAVIPFLILRRSPADAFFPIAFPISNAAATWVALMLLFPTGRPGVTLALALACLLLYALARAPVAHLGLAIFFVTVAIPLQFQDYMVTLCWLGESLALVTLAKARGNAVMRVSASLLLAVVLLSLLRDWMIGVPQPLAVMANMHFATNLMGAAVFAAVTVLSLGALSAGARGFGSWNWLAGFASVAFSLTLLVAVSLEIHRYWFCGAGFFRDVCGGYDHDRRAIAAGFSYSAWSMLLGASLMALGFLRRSAFLRWQALMLLAFSISKVFVNGVSQQSQGYRVLSFLALGVLLLAVSFAYQKDWLRLR